MEPGEWTFYGTIVTVIGGIIGAWIVNRSNRNSIVGDVESITTAQYESIVEEINHLQVSLMNHLSWHTQNGQSHGHPNPEGIVRRRKRGRRS